jgi:hypothetical protein
VVVEAREVLDKQWLSNAVNTMRDQTLLIVKACKALGYDDPMSEDELRWVP